MEKYFADISHEGKNAESYRDLKYIKILRYCLAVMYIWPCRELGERVNKFWMVKRFSILIISIIFFIMGAGYIVLNRSLPFFTLCHNFITLMIHINYMCRISIGYRKKYRNLAAEFFSKIHLFHHKHKSDFAMEIHIKVHKMSHVGTIYMVILMIVGVLGFNLIVIYTTYSKGMFDRNLPENFTIVYDHAVYYMLPFDYTGNLKGYLVVNVLNWYISFYCTLGLCVFDLYLFVMVFHVWGHFKILLFNLESFPKPKDVMFSESENKLVGKSIRECVNDHRYITSYIKIMSSEFGPVIFIYHAFHLVVCCLLLLQCSRMNAEALLRYGPLTVGVFQQLIQISLVFEALGTMNEKLITAVYDVPWESMDRPNRIMVQFFLLNTQEPVQVKAMGVVDVGVSTMAKILKTSFSYFTFLKTMDG